jgi:protein O-GlcNAc transferase
VCPGFESLIRHHSSPTSVAQTLQTAQALHSAGRLEEAEPLYKSILEADSQNVDALNLLGALLNQVGKFSESVEMMTRAVRCRPSDPALRNNLGNALRDAGRVADAEKSYRQALKRHPAYADAHSNLGALLHGEGRVAEAEQSLRRALALEPGHAEAHNHFGIVLADSGRLTEAVDAFRRALAIHPHFPQAHCNLGAALMKLGETAPGQAHTRLGNLLRERAPQANVALAHNDLGVALVGLGRYEAAVESYRQALALEPQLAATHSNLASALMALGRVDEAEQSCRQALTLEPDFAVAHTHLANTLAALGRAEEAEQSCRRAIALKPDYAVAYSNLALLSNYIPGHSAADIYATHREFGKRFHRERPRAHRNAGDATRRLRIGYVSADLRLHSVASFIEPVLRRHNRDEFEVTCYYNFPRSDATTQRLKCYAETWHEVFGLSDDALADMIRQHAIDILVDLSGHTAGNRLLTFARKPAPVQATWLGYLNTTGLDAMDWRITDPQACPQGALDGLHTERLLRLPDSQWCYQAPDPCPDTLPRSGTSAGMVTFGVFSVPAKINDQLIELWSRLLARLPRSRLFIGSGGLSSIPAQFRARLARADIDERRLEIFPSRPFGDYLALHNSVDVMLDTFPYTGGTTTCHALWMGVPVVSLVGNTATSRGGASLLHAVGLPELVAETPDQYLDIAAGLAEHPRRLASLRAGMRERMRSSPLMDAVRFTRHLEQACRKMWQTWCDGDRD